MTQLRIALIAVVSAVSLGCPTTTELVDAGSDTGRPDATSDAPQSDARDSIDAPVSLDSHTPDSFTPTVDAAEFDAPIDAAGDAGGDAPPSGDVLLTGTRATPTLPLLTCVGAQRMPIPGAPISGVLSVSAIGLSSTPVSASIQIHQGAAVASTCTAPLCSTVATDASGLATVVLPSGGWFAYRVPATTANVAGLGFFTRWSTSAGATTPVITLSPAASGIVTGQLNRELSTTTSGISGSVSDCSGDTMANARIRMFRGATEIISGAPTDTMTPRITGVGDTAIPMPTVSGRTSFMGRFGAVVPATGGDVRIEVWGTRTGASAEELIACEVVSVEPNGFTVAALGPYRDDYAAGHGCIGRRAP